MRLYQLDAFTDQLFCGNPAAVVPLTDWISDEQMQKIAAENNLAETAFYVKTEGDNNFHIRWFTPTVEVDLCGHATLATSYVVFFLEKQATTNTISFESRSGQLNVSRTEDNWLTLDFPADPVHKANVLPPALMASLGVKPVDVLKGRSDYMVVYDSEATVKGLNPDFREMSSIPARGIIVTAPADSDSSVDFVSRFFGPQSGVDEDPVTGSAHTTLIPYWAEKLGRNTMTARQISPRGGYLRCALNGDRVYISGEVQLYMTAEIRQL